MRNCDQEISFDDNVQGKLIYLYLTKPRHRFLKTAPWQHKFQIIFISISYDNWYSQVDWHRALHHCIADDMRLASILSREENDQVVKQIKDSGKPRDIWELWASWANILQIFLTIIHVVCLGNFWFTNSRFRWIGFVDEFWLGGTKLGNESNFYWMGQNKAFRFTNWLLGEPNNHEGRGEACLEVWPDHDYKWNDETCSPLHYFVCEENINVTE